MAGIKACCTCCSHHITSDELLACTHWPAYLSSRNVHGGWEGVIAALGTVHVVVRVHRALAAKDTPCQLDSTVGDDFVAVHVGLRSRASLPYPQWEVVVQLAVNHLLCAVLWQRG